MTSRPKSKRSRRGFSLTELMVVVLIVGVLAALSVPAYLGASQAAQVTTAAYRVLDSLTLARQIAISENRRVEVRLYQHAGGGEDPQYAAFATYKLEPNQSTALPAQRVEMLPRRVVIDPSDSYSPLVSRTGSSQAVNPAAFDARYDGNTRCFRFHPDGTTDLARNEQWFLTLRPKSQPGITGNWATVMLDPVTGAAKLLRP